MLKAPTPYTLTNPFNNGAPFPGNIIPQGLMSPVAAKLFASPLYPAPQNANLINNYYSANATITNQKQAVTRAFTPTILRRIRFRSRRTHLSMTTPIMAC